MHGRQDAELDIPDAAHLTSLFLGRAIVDEVLPPAFLTAVLRALSDDSLGVHIVQTVRERSLPLPLPLQAPDPRMLCAAIAWRLR